MEKFIIETRENYDYIISKEHGFALKVIPPENRDEDEYIPYQVVMAVFEDCSFETHNFASNFDPVTALDENELETDDDNSDADIYDFEGVDIVFEDDDIPNCNRGLWLEAINFYCKRKFGRTVVSLRPYNYNYELSELNCEPVTLALLNAPDEERLLPIEVFREMYAKGITSDQLQKKL